jgi:GNAT superfamily N-acetyltransferase
LISFNSGISVLAVGILSEGPVLVSRIHGRPDAEIVVRKTPIRALHNMNEIQFHTLTADRWSDFEKLFGPRGACAGCWCMYWRLSGPEFKNNQGEANKRAFRKVVRAGRMPGILAYDGREAVGWCAVGPREEYPRLDRSHVLARVDEKPVWSINCLYIARSHRKRGLSSALIKEAASFARSRGAEIVEGYPYEPGSKVADAFIYTGRLSSFLKAGFKEIARRSRVRPIVRWRAPDR